MGRSPNLLFFLKVATLRRVEALRSADRLMRDRNALGLLACAFRFRQRHGQDAVAECGARSVFIDLRRQSEVTLEASVRALAVLTVGVVELGALFAAKDEHIIFDAEFHIVFLKPR